ncbi:MAG: hypothetical protein Q8O76_01000 [Chloroflexota bacterium]|nr:hypothetical protein [Chloroflexota bacterium]
MGGPLSRQSLTPAQRLWRDVFKGAPPNLDERAVIAVVNTLDNREAWAVQLYYGLGGHPPLTLAQVGVNMWRVGAADVGVSRQRVYQVLDEARTKLRHPMRRAMWKAAIEHQESQ